MTTKKGWPDFSYRNYYEQLHAPSAFLSPIDPTATCCATAALTRHHTAVWTFKYVTVARAFSLVTTAALSHAPFTGIIGYDATPFRGPLQRVCVIWTWVATSRN